MEKQKEAKHGKKPNQKLKAYLVCEYLKRNTDEDDVRKPQKISFRYQTCNINNLKRDFRGMHESLFFFVPFLNYFKKYERNHGFYIRKY